MSFIAHLPRLPLAPDDGAPFPFVRDLPLKRHAELSACASRYPIFNFLGMQIEALEEDFCRIGLTHRLDLTNPMGGLHGGIIAAMLDSAVGLSMAATLKEGFSLATISLDVKFLRPFIEGHALAEARVRRKGRTVLFADTLLTDGGGETYATGTCVYMPIPIKRE
jgi:uncharacterized protein (TIGR00369 family)